MPTSTGSQTDIGDHPAPEGGSQKEAGRQAPVDDDAGSVVLDEAGMNPRP